jgi:hypothetical protein
MKLPLELEAIAGQAYVIYVPVVNALAREDVILGVSTSCSCLQVLYRPKAIAARSIAMLQLALANPESEQEGQFEYEVSIVHEGRELASVIRLRVNTRPRTPTGPQLELIPIPQGVDFDDKKADDM